MLQTDFLYSVEFAAQLCRVILMQNYVEYDLYDSVSYQPQLTLVKYVEKELLFHFK